MSNWVQSELSWWGYLCVVRCPWSVVRFLVDGDHFFLFRTFCMRCFCARITYTLAAKFGVPQVERIGARRCTARDCGVRWSHVWRWIMVVSSARGLVKSAAQVWDWWACKVWVVCVSYWRAPETEKTWGAKRAETREVPWGSDRPKSLGVVDLHS